MTFGRPPFRQEPWLFTSGAWGCELGGKGRKLRRFLLFSVWPQNRRSSSAYDWATDSANRPNRARRALRRVVKSMRFTPQFLEELKDRLPVSEVVGRRVKLQKAGREWKGLSPFNAEKTPSFTVNDQKGFFHDFSSNKHGNIFDFVMETEGLSFPEAVERLAAQAGVPLPAATPEDVIREKKRAGLHEVL